MPRMLSILVVLPVRTAASEGGTEPSSEEVSFFESRIRPVLAQRCYRCHAGKTRKDDFVLAA